MLASSVYEYAQNDIKIKAMVGSETVVPSKQIILNASDPLILLSNPLILLLLLNVHNMSMQGNGMI